MSDEPTQEQPIIPASKLLMEWREMNADRRKNMQERKENWMLPPIGIEEAVRINADDIYQAMWFLDKTIKLLAKQEESKNLCQPKN